MSLRSALESLYDCTARVETAVPFQEGAATRFRLETTIAAAPCRLSFSGASRQSFSGLQAAGRASPRSEAPQSVKLFLAPEWQVPAGSKITVTGRGGERVYCRSGEAAVCGSHQEIPLALWKELA